MVYKVLPPSHLTPTLDSRCFLASQVELFLQRIGESSTHLYNHENPKNLRYYVVSMFNTGMISTLIATKQIFADLKNRDFSDKKIATTKLKGIKNIIVMDLLDLGEDYNTLYKKFGG